VDAVLGAEEVLAVLGDEVTAELLEEEDAAELLEEDAAELLDEAESDELLDETSPCEAALLAATLLLVVLVRVEEPFADLVASDEEELDLETAVPSDETRRLRELEVPPLAMEDDPVMLRLTELERMPVPMSEPLGPSCQV